MKNSLILVIIGLLFSLQLVAQKSKKRTENFVEPGDRLISSTNQKVLIRTIHDEYIEKIFYPETKVITHYVTYADNKFQVKHGPYKEWFDNGRLWQEGINQNNKKEGFWTIYPSLSSNAKEVGLFENGMKSGIWTYRDSLGKILVERTFKLDKLDGPYKVYDKMGKLALLKNFADDKKISEETFLTGNPIDTFRFYERARMIGCEGEFGDSYERSVCESQVIRKFITNRIRYPKSTREQGIEGVAIFYLSINEMGEVDKITTYRGISREIEEECIRVLKFPPKFIPPIYEGKPKRSDYTIPIYFQLK